MLLLPAHSEVHILTSTAVEADKINKNRNIWKAFSELINRHKLIHFFMLALDLALNFYFLHYALSQQPTNATQSRKLCYPEERAEMVVNEE